MKKYLSLLAFAVLLIAGCAKEPKSAFADGDSFTTEFTVAMDAVNTRAVADNDGAAALVDECLIQIWMDVDGTYELYSTPAVTALDNLHYTFTATFIKNQNYKILVWADKSGFYTFADDATVSRNDLTVDNEDGLDAFYANVDIDASAPITNKTITARRPFAQLNVITTDLQKIPADFIPEFVSISYDAPASMNLLDETLGADSTFVIANSPVYFEGTTGVAAKSTLSMDYIFAPVDREVKNFVYSIAYTVPIDREFNNIPLQRNYRTNILGNLLSVDEEFLVIVDPIWNEPDYEWVIWDGTIAALPDPAADGFIHITTANELAGLAKAVNEGNTFSGKTIVLDNDLDLGNCPWTPIGNVTAYPGQTFQGTFDGQDHVIYNLNVSDNTAVYATSGLFGSIKGTIKNVTVQDFTVTSTHYAGAICGYSSENPTAIQNCKAINGTITSTPEMVGSEYDNGDKVGGIIGYSVTGSQILDNEVDGVTIMAYRDLGGIAGATSGTVTGNTVKNSFVCQSNMNAYKESVDTFHEIIGRDLGATASDNSFENVVVASYANSLEFNLAMAEEGATVVAAALSYGKVTIPADIAANVTLEGEDGAAVDEIIIPDGADITNFTIKGFVGTRTSSAALQSGFIGVMGSAKVDNLVIEDCTINGPGSKTGGAGVWIQNSTAAYPKSITVKDCAFAGLRYGFYTASAIEGTDLKFDGCSFMNMFSWCILVNNASVKSLDIQNCIFEGGDKDGDFEGTNMVKTGTITASNNPDFAFTFKDNTVLKAYGRFVGISAKVVNTTISGNTRNGADWTPTIGVIE